MTKTCPRCKRTLALEYFYKAERRVDGRQTYCKPCFNWFGKRWRRRNPEKNVAHVTAYQKRTRALVLEKYGGKCACCGETEPNFLTLDHIYGGGRAHRRRLRPRSGNALYMWLRSHGFPKGKIRLLCYNCNCAIGHYKICPHKKLK